MDVKRADYLKGGYANWQAGLCHLQVAGTLVAPTLIPMQPNGSFVYGGRVWRPWSALPVLVVLPHVVPLVIQVGQPELIYITVQRLLRDRQTPPGTGHAVVVPAAVVTALRAMAGAPVGTGRVTSGLGGRTAN